MTRIISVAAAILFVVLFFYGTNFKSKFISEPLAAAELEPLVKTRVKWQQFDGGTFKKARSDHRLVFLYLSPFWCTSCLEMDLRTFSEVRLSDYINTNYLPVKVDPERRPDLDSRYRLNSYPSCLILTPDGGVVGGSNYLSPDSLLLLVDNIQKIWQDNRQVIYSQADRMEAGFRIVADSLLPVIPSALIFKKAEEAVLHGYDSVYGGFGTQPKVVYPDVFEYFFTTATGDDTLSFRAIAEKSLVQQLALLDTVWGGFYHLGRFQDWSYVSHEKLLSGNAKILSNYLDFYQGTRNERFRQVAEKIIAYIDNFLRTDLGWGFYNSQLGILPDSGASFNEKDYFSGSDPDRRRIGLPPIDRSIYTESNAITVSAYLKAARILQRPDCAAYALATLKELKERALGSDGSLARDLQNTRAAPRGLIYDQTAGMAALIDAYEFTGDRDFLVSADKIAQCILTQLPNKTRGGLNDSPIPEEAAGRMAVGIRPFSSNCETAKAFMRLHYLTGKDAYRWAGGKLFEYLFRVPVKKNDLRFCQLASAYLWFTRPPVKFVTVGKRGAAYDKLLESLWQGVYPHSVIFQFETGKDKLQLGEMTFPESDQPLLFVCLENVCSVPISDPAELQREIGVFLRSH